jgi:hypothetical protein
MTHWIVKLALPLIGALVTGCAAMGTGAGLSDPRPVDFDLKSSDAISGSINAAAPDDKPSSGEFF